MRSYSSDSNDSHCGSGKQQYKQRKNLQPRSNIVFDNCSPFSSPEKPARKRYDTNHDSVGTVLQHHETPSLSRTNSHRVAPGGRTTIVLG